uniref:Reverse transcriptase domain-containing protein n=1 Tax=Esox lucius TaxID=8010 RepID=A0AAY5KU42_ESOLU
KQETYYGIHKIILWNISGCNHVIKRKKILTYLKHNKTDKAMLQETHLSAEESEKLKRGWIAQVYSSRWIALDSSLEGQKVRNTQLDKSSHKQAIPLMYTAIDTMVDECGLIDIWRTLHRLEKDFTLFSHPHGSYSRIDYILISKQLVCQVQSASIGNIVLTPVDVVFTTSNYKKNTRWRFNNSLLQNETSCSFIQTAIDEYWLFNDGSVPDPGTTWDAFKAFLRGRLIQHCSLCKRLEREKLVKLEEKISTLKKQHINHPDPVTLNNLNSLKLEINVIIQKIAEFALFCTKLNYYKKGEKAGKYLAHRPLAIAIRNNPNIKDIIAGHQEHKVLLYADDILLFSSNPQLTVPTFISHLPRQQRLWCRLAMVSGC